MDQEPTISPQRGGLLAAKSVLIWAFFMAFVGGGFYSGLISVPRLVGWVEAVAPAAFTSVLPFELVSAGNKVVPDWRNQERVNVLLMGVDTRPNEQGVPARSDTMMLLTIDPYSKSAGVLSIPRDLYVPIPYKPGQVIQDRVNTATFYGDYYQYPGGGPALAKETIQYNLGIRVHYFVLIDFDGFQRIIDALGGVDIDVQTPLVDNQYPTMDYGIKRVSIPSGYQHMDGEEALVYVRTRHADSDFSRNKRQQDLLMAVRKRILQLDTLPKLPGLWSEFHDSVRTDMTLTEVLALAGLARDIPQDRITTTGLGPDAAVPFITYDGADILVPNRKKIADIVQSIFFDARRQEESAKIEVLNGTKVQGLATKTAGMLQTQGFGDVAVGDAAGVTPSTQVQVYGGQSYTAGQLASLLKVPREQVLTMPRPQGTDADIRVILGEDAR